MRGVGRWAALIGILAGMLSVDAQFRDRPRPISKIQIPEDQTVPNRSKVFFQRGVNFTSETGYFPDDAMAMLDRLPGYGVNSLALVPYGVSRKGVPEVRLMSNGGMEREDDIQALTALAHQRHLKVLLKPQVWVTSGGYPGGIEFPEPEARASWFRSYEEFILHFADLATRSRADLFCVGVEFVHLSQYESEWRRIIARVRQRYAGPLVYAANSGPDFEQTRFWDALDYIGLNDYYPLPDDLSVAAVLHIVEGVQRRYHRPVIFPEAGFASLRAPHREPWDETPREKSLEDQARCYEALLRAFYKKPWFQGVYWWKVGNNGFGGPEDTSHTPWGKPAMEVIKKWYVTGGR